MILYVRLAVNPTHCPRACLNNCTTQGYLLQDNEECFFRDNESNLCKKKKREKSGNLLIALKFIFESGDMYARS